MSGTGATVAGDPRVSAPAFEPATGSRAYADDRAGALATFFTAGYVGVSLPVVGVGVALQYLSPRVTLLIFALAAGLGILAAARILVRPPPAARQGPRSDDNAMTTLCRGFGAPVGPDSSVPGEVQ